MSGATAEERWWNSLDASDAFLNTAGDPPYDVASVGAKIWLSLGEPKLDARLLDLGCGQGRLTNAIAAFLRSTDAVVHGVDISRALLDVAVIDAQQQNLRNVHYWHNDGRRLPNGLGGRKYDLVYSVAMFQHVPHEAMWGYIRQVEPRLNRGGVFTFTIAVGEVDEFLNHQIADVQQFCTDLMQLFDSVAIDMPIGDDFQCRGEHGWTWVTVRKEG